MLPLQTVVIRKGGWVTRPRQCTGPARAVPAELYGGGTPSSIICREAGDLLAGAPDNALSILGEAAGPDSTAPRLLLLLDDARDRLSRLAQRLADAGYAGGE
ncbi:hypothetical protein ACWD4J_40305 [Streptomyces sp. NPDC002577]